MSQQPVLNPFGGVMNWQRMPIEKESPEEFGYSKIKYNLAESSITDTVLPQIFDFEQTNSTSAATALSKFIAQKTVLCYGDHKGLKPLRELLAKQSHLQSDEQILLTIGAAHALFLIATSLLSKQDRLIVTFPNYSTNLETPERAIGCKVNYLDLKFESNWELPLQQLEEYLNTYDDIKLISLTTPHNPTGTLLVDEAKLKKVIELARAYQKKHNKKVFVLVDETYRDMNFHTAVLPKLAVTYSDDDDDHQNIDKITVMTVSSLSKSYGLPGLRLGWVLTKNATLMETLLAAKEQSIICGSIVDEELGYLALSQKEEWLPKVQKHIEERFAVLKKWMEQQTWIEWVEPKAGVVTFARIKEEYYKKIDIEQFYKVLIEKYNTFAGPGHWFYMEKRYMRLGFGWPTVEELEKGLEGLTNTFKDVCQQ